MRVSASLEILQTLVEVGVDPGALPKRGGFAPLRKAIALQNLDYVDFILELGVDPNLGLDQQRYTLTAVTQCKPALAISVLKRLVEKGVDLNLKFTWFGDPNVKMARNRCCLR